MFRLFQTHEVRREVEIPPIWKFAVEGEQEGTMVVPGCWETIPRLASYRGKAVYSQTITIGGNARIVFKGVSHTAKVYFDGELLGSHYGAYGDFSFLVTNLEYKEHILQVEVDNSYSEASALHVNNDYYTYGGIIRPVLIEIISEVYMRELHFTPIYEKGQWSGKTEVVLENIADVEQKISLDVAMDDSHFSVEDIYIPAKTSMKIEDIREYHNVIEYTLSNPKLYYVKARVKKDDKVIDDLIDRIGFRTVQVEGNDILFNGEKLHLKGFNRHEDYAEFGSAIPLTAMYRDMEILKELGANCVRTSHYPNDERWLDLCDEQGILVWEEAHARGLSEDQMRNPNFDWQSEQCINEMIHSHYNHPSIFVWGILNECASFSEYGRSCYEKQIKQIKTLDSHRPVTFASCHIGSDRCLDLVDIVSFNIYPGWYFDDSTKNYLTGLKDWIAKTEGKGKPLIISEIGAGAIYGFRSSNKAKWTEEYQAELLEEQIRAVLSDEQCSGVILWQFADCRVDNGSFYARPKSQNNKGIVDIYRREKLAYGVVKNLFQMH